MLRRFILLCLVFVLPFQMAWAAAGAYCEHEQGQAAHHFGHHDHVHKSTPADKNNAKGAFDSDCSAHAQASLQAFATATVALGLPIERSVQQAPDTHLQNRLVIDRPDRPQWLAAV